MEIEKKEHTAYFLEGGGEMGLLCRQKDWSATALGSPEYWPVSLTTTLSILLNSKFPMFLFWGPELICFYNDAYRPSLGEKGKHPNMLGAKGKEAWTEIWPIIGPLIKNVMEEGESFWFEDELIPIYRNGGVENVYWTFSYSPVLSESGTVAGVVVICSETTDRLQRQSKLLETSIITKEQLEQIIQQRTAELSEANRQLKKSEERYHLMVSEVQDYAILYINCEGIVENWNIGAEKIKGYKAEEILGKSFSVFYTREDRENGLPQRLLKEAELTGRARQEGWRLRKDGTLFWANVTITAVHNDKKEVIGFSKVTHDLTEKRYAENRLRANAELLTKKNEELKRINKELDSFAYISSHDLQEPLRKIQTFATRLLQNEYPNLSDSGKEELQRMQNAAVRMQALINDLLTYSRASTSERKYERVNLDEILHKVRIDLRENLKEKNAVIETGDTCIVSVIPFQFHQLLINLIDNSLKFSRPGVAPHIKIEAATGTGAEFGDQRLSRDSKYCRITLSDNGIGFEQQFSEKIFELFQRLHGRSAYSGTGIGLAIVKKIVENHRGIITASGELDKGATFTIYISA